MGNCGDKVKHTCGGVYSFSLCTKYEGSISQQSSLSEDDCLDVQEVIEDIYDITEDLYSKIDMSGLDNDCITFTEPRTPASIIEQILLKICQLEDLVQTQQETIETMQEEIDNLQSNICE